MKFLFSFLLVLFSFSVSASDFCSTDVKSETTIEFSLNGDKGRKKGRKTRRVNKKRKRKCAKFGRRAFAG